MKFTLLMELLQRWNEMMLQILWTSPSVDNAPPNIFDLCDCVSTLTYFYPAFRFTFFQIYLKLLGTDNGYIIFAL